MKKWAVSTTGKIVFVVLMMATLSVRAVDIPSIPEGHPRVYVRPNDLPNLKAKLNVPEFSAAWRVVQESDHMLCRAFVYLTQKDRTAGRDAINKWFAHVNDVRNNPDREGRHWDNVMHLGACIYDWCYPLLTEPEKQRFIDELKRVANSHSPDYPARNDARVNTVVGHDTEGWVLTGQLPAGIAIYDELPWMYNAAAELFFERFVPVRNLLYAAHMHHQGDSYIVSRFQHDISVAWLFRRLGAGHVFSQEQQYVPYQMIYNMRPDIKQMVSGDTFDDRGDRWNKRMIHMMTGTYYQDPYLMWLTDSTIYRDFPAYVRVFELLFRQPNMAKKPIGELPLTKLFAPPMAEMVTRTGWKTGVGSPNAVITMRIGETFFGNHQKKDFGTFQIYYKGALALSTGVYDDYGDSHWKNYYHQTISHNGLLIYDPSEHIAKDAANDGGQRWPTGTDHPKNLTMLRQPDYKMGTLLAHEFGPDKTKPEYSYISGDITHAYAPQKAAQVTRSMVTFNTNNETYPAIFVVFDRVTSKNPTFKKTWLLHTLQEPDIQDRTITVIRDGNAFSGGQYTGKLIAQSLLPEQATLTKVGGSGREFLVNGQSYPPIKIDPDTEPGAWRIEISPTTQDTSHLFLHAMTVMDATTNTDPPIKKITNDQLVGVSIMDHAVFFGRDSTLLSTAAIEISNTQKVLVCNLKPGVWSIQKAGKEIQQITVTPKGHCAYFELESGSYQLKHVTLQNDTDASSSDFDNSGTIDFIDFILFTTAFGAQQTDERYHTRYDLDNSGYIGFTDFILFASVFGTRVAT